MVIAGGRDRAAAPRAKRRASTEPAMVIAGGLSLGVSIEIALHLLQRSRRW